jgi:uncharacterized membrane protein
MTPLLELRVSIPLGYGSLGLSIYESILISVLGGIISVALTLYLLPFFISIAEKNKWLKKIIRKILEKTQKKHTSALKKWGDIFLVLFVAIPLPGSGAFSGALAAYIFGIKNKKALVLISLGIIISGILVGILTIFGNQIWENLK